VASARAGSSSGADPPRPPHVIRPNEVDAWLADSVNKQVTYHRTTRALVQDILEHGVDISRSRIAAYGQGFYTATDVSQFAGDADLAVAVRTRHPLVGYVDDMIPWFSDLVDLLTGGRGTLTPAVAARIRQELLDLGYDGVIVRDAGGDGVDFVIALHGHLVKVVQP
jgi:hypothetical protein